MDCQSDIKNNKLKMKNYNEYYKIERWESFKWESFLMKALVEVWLKNNIFTADRRLCISAWIFFTTYVAINDWFFVCLTLGYATGWSIFCVVLRWYHNDNGTFLPLNFKIPTSDNNGSSCILYYVVSFLKCFQMSLVDLTISFQWSRRR